MTRSNACSHLSDRVVADVKNGPWAANGGWEYNAVLIGAVTALAETGPGDLSLDHALGTERSGPEWALASLATESVPLRSPWPLGDAESLHLHRSPTSQPPKLPTVTPPATPRHPAPDSPDLVAATHGR